MATSLTLGALDALGAVLPIAGLVDDVDESFGKFFAATLVLLVLTSVLPPIMRRLARPRRADQPRNGDLDELAEEIKAIADRIDELNRDPGVRAPEIRREVERLRGLAGTFQPPS